MLHYSLVNVTMNWHKCKQYITCLLYSNSQCIKTNVCNVEIEVCNKNYLKPFLIVCYHILAVTYIFVIHVSFYAVINGAYIA